MSTITRRDLMGTSAAAIAATTLPPSFARAANDFANLDAVGMATRIDFKRYRKVRRFVTRTFLHFLWWDVLLAYPPLSSFRRPPVKSGVAPWAATRSTCCAERTCT